MDMPKPCSTERWSFRSACTLVCFGCLERRSEDDKADKNTMAPEWPRVSAGMFLSVGSGPSKVELRAIHGIYSHMCHERQGRQFWTGHNFILLVGPPRGSCNQNHLRAQGTLVFFTCSSVCCLTRAPLYSFTIIRGLSCGSFGHQMTIKSPCDCIYDLKQFRRCNGCCRCHMQLVIRTRV